MAHLPKLISTVARLGLDGEQLAEMLWLAAQIRDGAAAAEADCEPPASPGNPGPTPIVDQPEPAAADVEVTATAPVRPTAVGDSPATVLGLPGPASLHPSRLLRELRPLARRAVDPGRQVFDEPASIERTAATGVAWPVTRPGLVRNREVALVLDRHRSMAAWEGLAAEVQSLLESVGGFRKVVAWYLDETEDGRLVIGSRARGPSDRPISALRDPTGRRVIMVLTAGLGDAWSWGTAQADLAGLSDASPVVIAQPLPPTLWPRTGLACEMGRLRPDPGGELVPLRKVSSQAPADALPIPVLQLAEGWLGPFADLLTGSLSHARFPLAMRQPIVPVADRRTVASRQEAELGTDPVERIRRFRSASSPEAYRLAAYLSIPQLALPVMRLILRTASPRIDPSALAEVLCGGLLTSTGDDAPYSGPEDLREFAFPEPVRQVLRQTVRRSEARDILRATEKYLVETYDVSPHLFRATLSTPSDTSGGHPFALIPLSRLTSLAPAFASVVDSEEWENYDIVIGAAHNAGEPAAVEDALAALRRMLRSLRPGHPARDGALRGMAELLSRRFANSGDLADLDEAIVASKAALAESDETLERAEPLAALARILGHRFKASGEIDYLIDAVRVLRAAVSYRDGDQRHEAQTFEDLGDALLLLGEHLNDPALVMNAADVFAAAADTAVDIGQRGVVQLKSAQAFLLILHLAAYSESVSAASRAIKELRGALRNATPSTDFAAALERVVGLAAEDHSRASTRARIAEVLGEEAERGNPEPTVRALLAAAAERLAEISDGRAR